MNMNDENVTMESPTYCAFCGEIFPTDAPSGLEAAQAHVAVCAQHPIAKYKSRLAEAEKVVEAAENLVEHLKRSVRVFAIDKQCRDIVTAVHAHQLAKEV